MPTGEDPTILVIMSGGNDRIHEAFAWSQIEGLANYETVIGDAPVG
jgi:hypothetical protein